MKDSQIEHAIDTLLAEGEGVLQFDADFSEELFNVYEDALNELFDEAGDEGEFGEEPVTFAVADPSYRGSEEYFGTLADGRIVRVHSDSGVSWIAKKGVTKQQVLKVLEKYLGTPL